jgi:hydroxybutyrate-dimer hydrolase
MQKTKTRSASALRGKRSQLRVAGVAVAMAAAGLLGGCDDGDSNEPIVVNVKPAFVGNITKTVYDGVSDDLLTAGLGKSGLQGAAPTFADPNAPTPAELRRYAIYNNYRPLVDITTAGGYGTLYGPNIDSKGNVTAGEGKIAGTEYIAYDDDGTGKQNVAMMVQVPSTFDTNNPCIVTATSPAARGVYGAISSAGEWGLKKGCAVAYTDKGTGVAIHDLQGNTVGLIDGRRATASAAGAASYFTAPLSAPSSLRSMRRHRTGLR